MIRLIKKLWSMELVRYLFAGGTAFLFDKLAFFLFNSLILPDLGSWWIVKDVRNMISVLVGFLVGLLINNFISMYLVFTSESQKKKSRTARAFIEFTVVGIIGLALSIGGNQLCILLFEGGDTKELIYNIIIAIPVTAWNYIGRKFFVREKKVSPEDAGEKEETNG
ncbi:MAG: GtrA family protein [Clostridia bacterium]|nr:GtrA family protein [Clostridia bacterium]